MHDADFDHEAETKGRHHSSTLGEKSTTTGDTCQVNSEQTATQHHQTKNSHLERVIRWSGESSFQLYARKGRLSGKGEKLGDPAGLV